MYGPTRIVWANLTPFSLQGAELTEPVVHAFIDHYYTLLSHSEPAAETGPDAEAERADAFAQLGR
jgi:hypothetical protein